MKKDKMSMGLSLADFYREQVQEAKSICWVTPISSLVGADTEKSVGRVARGPT